ncbi:HAMP domain-containing protein [Croceicoccus ponticola]|uniref:histidine kinase n=1 Tax=Croceicoccus ponticola TaxID=2217664 RepID=A0A437H0X4_9SPHN|nr:ATP-binding protein [Croceicoccus ponticola]RVQ69162.1 HAMP domain-containing protein [Croceicoccus ponticola]
MTIETSENASLAVDRRPLPGPEGLDWSRFSRRFGVFWYRANGFVLLELLLLAVLLLVLFGGWLTLGADESKGQLLPLTTTTSLLVATLIPAMGLLMLLGRRLALRRARRLTGSTGRLHVRLVFFFSLIAAVPTLLVVAFASYLFQSGVEFWFSERSRGLLEDANQLARGYYEQNLRDIGDETVAMAGDVRFYLSQANIASPEFAEAYTRQVIIRELNESAIIERGKDGMVRTAAIVDPDEEAGPHRIEPSVFDRLAKGETVVVSATAKRIEAVTPLDTTRGIFLYTARKSDEQAQSQWQRAQSVLANYDSLIGNARKLQLQFNIALLGVSLALVALAVWFALRFADRQVEPLAELLAAARDVGSGDFSKRVAGRTGNDEIGLLNRAFNRMTEQIAGQTQALIEANELLVERRAFTEAVLDSATAGIVSVDDDGNILLINGSAMAMLFDGGEGKAIGRPLAEIAPALRDQLVAGRNSGIVQQSRGTDTRTLAVKIARTRHGSVLTFEDITRQLLDQRRAAWSDVARRIAHEIKNPLTPIQLATERLNRRYRRQISTDIELFDELTQTIIRQVGDLRKMVDEFSSFARMPKPSFRDEDMTDLVRQAMFLQEVGNSHISYRFEGEEGDTTIACDRHQVGQAMTNVLKNAAEAIETRASAANVDEDYKGRIVVHLKPDREGLTVTVTDNGIGLPREGRNIVEPYMTTREKGTGLGLAIVQKILGEHGGNIAFETAEDGGTRVRLRFSRNPLADLAPDDGKEAAE